MNDLTETKPAPPQHLAPRKSVWNDRKGRTWVIWDIWQSGRGYEIEMMELNAKGPKVVSFTTQPWVTVRDMITSGAMARAWV